MSNPKLFAFGACAALLSAPASSGLPVCAGADGAVTPQNLVSLSYSSGGRLHEVGLLLKADGVAQADVWDSRESAAHRRVVNKLSPVQFAAILHLVSAVNFPALKPQHNNPRQVDGVADSVSLIYRDRAGHRQEYDAWTWGYRPTPLAQLCSSLSDIADRELKGMAVRRGTHGRRHSPQGTR